MARHGLNCTLKWSDGSAMHTYSVRCDMVTHGVQMIYEESQARRRKAFYPHRLAMSQFAINVMLKGNEERKSFNDWLRVYASFILKPELAVGEFPPMLVSVPSRKFLERGVLLSGYQFGDKLGVMVWNHTLVFESTPALVLNRETADWAPPVAQERDENLKYFYPLSEQLSGSDAPLIQYNQIVEAASTAAAEQDEPAWVGAEATGEAHTTGYEWIGSDATGEGTAY